jgi:hypothetical protein
VARLDPAAKNNRQSTPATSQNAAARGGAVRRECSAAALIPGQWCRSAVPLARSRLVWVPDKSIAGSS